LLNQKKIKLSPQIVTGSNAYMSIKSLSEGWAIDLPGKGGRRGLDIIGSEEGKR
jgi:hypothetical protein